MSIRASSSKQIDTLIADLRGPDLLRRDAAVARLIVLGSRAVDRVADVATENADVEARLAAFRALDGIGDKRAVAAALEAIDDPNPTVAQAAIALAGRFLKSAKGTAIVDRLTATALDASRDASVRRAALAALSDLGPKAVAPLLKALGGQLQGSQASQGSRGSRGSQGSRDSAAEVREWIAREGAKASLTTLLGIVERVREREGHEAAATRAEWATARMAAHLALARRGSRVALYDLKESLERSTAPLPVDALAALGLIGDASCLEPIASAYTRSTDTWWRDHLLETFHAIVKREKLTARHAVVRKVRKRFGTG